jgi:hypothetical protein
MYSMTDDWHDAVYLQTDYLVAATRYVVGSVAPY